VAALTHPSIRELGRRLRTRELTALELTLHTLEDIEEREATLNAFTTVLREAAVEQARDVDAALARGDDPGPLAGIPVAIKDLFNLPGAPTTGGSSLFGDQLALGEADVVAGLRRAGAVLVGKTNLNEFCWGLDPHIGRVNNPLDPRLTAGGSSGGSAAAVASGSVPAAIGTDSGGSIRMPAAFCGLVGLKPTHGLIPIGGTVPGCWSLTDAGPIARSVADVATILDCLSPARTTSHSPPARPTLGILAGSLDACRTEIAAPIRHALDVLDSSGWQLTDIEFDLDDAHDAWMTTFAAETREALVPFLGVHVRDVSVDLRELLRLGAGITAMAYLEAQTYRSRLGASLDAILRTVDAIVTPTVPSPPGEDDPEADDEEYFGDMRWTIAANLTGHPALTIPLGSPRTPPAGLQLLGRYGADDSLLGLASRLEEELLCPDAEEETR
jgi:Asp-tRNA(Asn)/Glu-tRNA(Gln) amidotransferase A subunit family amidase